MMHEKSPHPADYRQVQVKVCGLTHPPEAEKCAELGVDAVGCVFYPPSPRYVTRPIARDIARAVAGRAACVGVFVDPDFDEVCRVLDFCRIDAVQLHGRETPGFVGRLRRKGVLVIKTLFAQKFPDFQTAGDFLPDAFLVEQGGGRLPGGNAEDWCWSEIKHVSTTVPLILAGGLRPDNVSEAIHDAQPDAVDVSSGVEASPGRKDAEKIRALLQIVRTMDMRKQPRRIFP